MKMLLLFGLLLLAGGLIYRKIRDAAAFRQRWEAYIPGGRRKAFAFLDRRFNFTGFIPSWFDTRRDQRIFWAFFVFGGLACGFLIGSWWLCVPAGLASGLGVVYFLYRRRKRIIRQQFLDNFPDAVDSLARLVTAGRPIETGLVDMARHLPDPIAEQFADIGRKIELGIPFGKILRDLMEYLDTPEFDYFCTVLIINRDTGGKVVEIMAGLSHNLREKRNSARQLRIMTSEPRSAARIVALIPIGVLGLNWFSDPQRFYFLLEDPVGKTLLAYAISSIIIGLLVINRMSRLR